MSVSDEESIPRTELNLRLKFGEDEERLAEQGSSQKGAQECAAGVSKPSQSSPSPV
jgi:hypothetical protein